MYNYTWDIPKRLKKKEGFAGTISNKDLLYTAISAVIGILLVVLSGGGLLGIVGLVACGVFAYFMFIMKDAYGDNARVKLLRSQQFRKKQNLYYYYRGTAPKGAK